MTGHTKDPLLGRYDYPFRVNDFDEVEDATGYSIGAFDVTNDDVGLRFTECVNALAGMNPSALAGLIEAAEGLVEYAKQGRGVTADHLNALLAALANLRGESAGPFAMPGSSVCACVQHRQS